MGSTVIIGSGVPIILCTQLIYTGPVVERKRWSMQVSREDRVTKFVKLCEF